MREKGFLVLLVILMLFTVTGCNSKKEIVKDATSAYLDEYGGEVTDSKIDKYDGSMPENHIIMISYILNSKDMEYELDEYKDLYLIFLTNEKGEERAVVYVDGEIILPNDN